MKAKLPRLPLVSPCIVLFSFLSCQNNPAVVIPEHGFTMTPLKEWTCIGPFRFDSTAHEPATTFFLNDLEAYGIDETRFEKNDFGNLPRSLKTFKIEDQHGTIDFMEYVGEDRDAYSNYYLYAEFESETGRDAVLISDGSFAYRIWLNGNPVVSDYWKKNTYKFADRFTTVQLEKGTNRIFVKANRGSNVKSWKLNVTLSNAEEARRVFFENCLHDFVRNPNFSDTLFFYVGPHVCGTVGIRDDKNQSILAKPFKTEDIIGGYVAVTATDSIKSGFYTATLSRGDYSMFQKIYKGNLRERKEYFEKKIASLSCDDTCRNELQTAYGKFAYCLSQIPDSLSRSERQYWDNNRVFHGSNLENSLLWIDRNKNLKGCPGTLFKSYYSETEKHYFSYLFHSSGCPEEIAKKPVILMIPWALDENNFITDCYYSNLDQMHMDMHLADQAGFSIAWPFLRGTNYSVKSADIEIAGIIKSLLADYSIDPGNIFLDGDCVGGYRALLLASRNPDLFAGVAVHGPVTQGQAGHGPVNLVRNLSNVPTCIVHGIDDQVVPIQYSRKYKREAEKFGVSIDLIEKEGGKYSITKAYHTDSFQKLKAYYEKKKEGLPSQIQYGTYDGDEKRIYWVTISPEYTDGLKTIDIRYDKPQKTIVMETSGIESITIDLAMLSIGPEEEITVLNNGNEVFKGRVGGHLLTIN